jgi:hypothetical protein
MACALCHRYSEPHSDVLAKSRMRAGLLEWGIPPSRLIRDSAGEDYRLVTAANQVRMN